MRLRYYVLSTVFCFASGVGVIPARLEAGCFDWLCGKKQPAPAYPVGPPVPVGQASGYAVYPPAANVTAGYAPYTVVGGASYATNYGTYYGPQMPVVGAGGAGYTNPPPSGVAATTMPSTMSYVPDFRSSAYRTPVTYYRPIMTTDPNTGAQVVALAPCTSYEYQTNRVPAMGDTALYNPNVAQPIQPAPSALPTYTLPSGGIPLASTTPTYPTTPYTTGYGGYTTLQPSTSSPVSSYPTPVYEGNAGNGGCVGSYPQPSMGVAPTQVQPGMTLPNTSAPAMTLPQVPGATITPAPTWGQKTTPPSGNNSVTPPPTVTPPPMTTPAPSGQLPGVYPPDGRSEVPPSLPPGFGTSANNSTNSSGMRSLARQQTNPTSSGDVPSLSFPAKQPAQSDAFSRESDTSGPQLAPIPVPDDFEFQPKWNPGLLKEEDLTALRPTSPPAFSPAGASKAIHWASFEDANATAQAAYEAAPKLREIDAASTPASQASRERYDVQMPRMPAMPTPQTSSSYETSGWRASR
ncbi:MAG: hypothetical protein NXI32_27235 [bacterium]|nr:hypothetical protein [bacterium]